MVMMPATALDPVLDMMHACVRRIPPHQSVLMRAYDSNEDRWQRALEYAWQRMALHSSTRNH